MSLHNERVKSTFKSSDGDTWDLQTTNWKNPLAYNIISLHGSFLRTGDSHHPHPIKNARQTMDLLPQTYGQQRLHIQQINQSKFHRLRRGFSASPPQNCI